MRPADFTEFGEAISAQHHRHAAPGMLSLLDRAKQAAGVAAPRVRLSRLARPATQPGPGGGGWLLMGWSGGGSPPAQVKMKFPDARTAAAFAERSGWVAEGHADPSPRRQESPERADDETTGDAFERWDKVDEANRDSFPASDPPPWTGTTVR